MRVLNSLSDLNVSRILRLIWQEKRISRIEIAGVLKIDKSTVTKIISELTRLGLVRETESGESGPQGGRKPVFLEITGTYACVGGIEINTERMYCCLVDLCGQVLYEQLITIDPDSYELKGCLGFFKDGYDILIAEAKKSDIPLAGIGIGLSGMIDAKTGCIVQSIPLMVFEPLNIIQKAKEFSSVPIFIDNDARCCCYTEQMISEKSINAKNMMYVMTEFRPIQPVKDAPKNISVGLGLVFNGRIYHGANSAAGEFRSILWKNGSPTQFSTGTEHLDSLENREIIEPMFRELAQNIAFLVNTLTLDAVYVGGIEHKYADELIKYIREATVYLWPYEWKKTTLITRAAISNRAVSYGAACMVLDKLFGIPELNGTKQESTALNDDLPSAYAFLTSLRG